MTQKQKKFCECYLMHFNATQAALQAGYSTRSARSIGQENLTKPDIQSYLEERVRGRVEKMQLSADFVIDHLITIASGQVTDFLEYKDNKIKLKPLNENTKAHAISLLHQKDSGYASQITIKLRDSVKALAILAKCLGLFEQRPLQEKIQQKDKSDEIIQEALKRIKLL